MHAFAAARKVRVGSGMLRHVRGRCTPAMRMCLVQSSPAFAAATDCSSFCATHHRLLYRNYSSSHNTFVSSYYQLADPQEISEFLSRKRLVCKETDTHYIVRECPFCHATHGKRDNLFKLYVMKAQGVYKCHRCGASGSWFDFKSKLQSNVSVTSVEGIMHHGSPAHVDRAAEIKVIQALDNEKAMAIQQNLLEEPEYAGVLHYLTQKRGLKKETLQKYCVGAIDQPFYNESGEQIVAQCISFPWMARAMDLHAMGVICETNNTDESNHRQDKNLFDVVRLKIRAVDDKAKQRLVPKGGSWGLFGWNTIPTTAEEIVLTEGEFDAMAVYQATGLPSASLPNGCQSLPPSVLPLLERFKKIYLWMDSDAAGQANVEKFATKLGITRCYIVRPATSTSTKSIKDANDALLAGMDLKKIVQAAERIPHSQIATFEHLRRDVYEEILNPLRACGVQSRSLPSLNRLLKGHRMGEVTVLTGPTGCGKTTLLSQLSLDLCGQGVSTLWGSFEIKNTRLIHKMLTQLSGRSLQGDIATFERAADKFEALPMYFMRFFGSTEVDEVLDAMEYAVYAYDVQHILLDNVQFMMAGQGRGFDKFERQDAALDKFRRFASQKNVHLTLVIHPRKEQEDVDLTLTSVFGTAKATQEADNVLILQRTRGNSKLDVRKNRFDGTLGSIPLWFDSKSNCLKEFNEETMTEEVASVDMEAQMVFEQKLRQQHSTKQVTAEQEEKELLVSLPSSQQQVESEEEASSSVVYNYHRDDEFFEEENTPLVAQQYQYASSNRVNGSSSHKMNSNDSYNGWHSDEDRQKNPNGASSGGLNGNSKRSGPNGAVNGSIGGEPFASFTPIITR